ncbi:MAG: hypothetical protein AAGT88_07440 [Dethiobacter sp.]
MGAVILFSPLNELEGVLAQARKVVWFSGNCLKERSTTHLTVLCSMPSS